MGLRDRAVNALRAVFGAEREDRAAAESPSTAAAASQPASIFSTFGREEVSGMLSVSQSLIDRFADYEAMEEYPDIGCLAGDTKILLIEGSVVTTTTIEELAKESSGREILGFDVKAKKMVKVTGAHPRLTALDAETVLLDFGQHKIRCTPDHKILTTDGYFEAKDLHKGTLAIGMWAGFNQNAEATISASLRFGTHELLADPTPAGRTKVFDITTETHNFVANGIVVHNSSFRYYAGDATQPNIQDSRTVWAQSEDRAIQEICDDLLKKKLKVEDEAWSQAYSLGMMGNEYSELLVTEDGVVGLNHLPAPTMRRVEAIDGGLIGYVQDVTGQFTANSHELRTMLAGNVDVPPNLALFEDWQVVHMRLRGTRRRSPYGVGVGEPARWIWKRLIILEDIAVIYRLNRIPRYVYRVDVTDVPPDRVESHLRKMKRDLRKKKYVNPKTGRFDMRYGAFAQDEDIFVAVRDGKELAGVDILSAPDWNTVEDLDYFKRMLHGTLNVPRAWLGQDEPIQGKGVLSNEDVRAARTTLNLQREMRNGYERMCRVHLAARGLKDPWKPDLNILMTVPSGIWELVAYETLNARADYAARVVPYMSIQWIQENVLKLDEETRKKIKAERKEELQDGNPFATSLGMPPPMQMDPNQPQGDPNQQGQPNQQGAPNPKGQGAQEDDEPPFKLKTASDWKAWDQQRRLEEWRHQQSRQNHQEIIDKLGKLMERQDDTFVARERDRQDFFKSVKDVALQVRAGRTVPVPSARSRPHHRNGRTSV